MGQMIQSGSKLKQTQLADKDHGGFDIRDTEPDGAHLLLGVFSWLRPQISSQLVWK